MKEVVWVNGLSAAGKETFIHKIVDDRPEDLLDQFGWKDKKISASQISLQAIGNYGDAKAKEERKRINDEVASLAEQSDVILIKSQHIDYKAGRHMALKTMLPAWDHKLFYIKVPLEDMAERLEAKPWWKHNEDPIDWAKAELPGVEGELKDLGEEIPVVVIDGSKNAKYKLI